MPSKTRRPLRAAEQKAYGMPQEMTLPGSGGGLRAMQVPGDSLPSEDLQTKKTAKKSRPNDPKAPQPMPQLSRAASRSVPQAMPGQWTQSMEPVQVDFEKMDVHKAQKPGKASRVSMAPASSEGEAISTNALFGTVTHSEEHAADVQDAHVPEEAKKEKKSPAHGPGHAKSYYYEEGDSEAEEAVDGFDLLDGFDFDIPIPEDAFVRKEPEPNEPFAGEGPEDDGSVSDQDSYFGEGVYDEDSEEDALLEDAAGFVPIAETDDAEGQESSDSFSEEPTISQMVEYAEKHRMPAEYAVAGFVDPMSEESIAHVPAEYESMLHEKAMHEAGEQELDIEESLKEDLDVDFGQESEQGQEHAPEQQPEDIQTDEELEIPEQELQPEPELQYSEEDQLSEADEAIVQAIPDAGEASWRLEEVEGDSAIEDAATAAAEALDALSQVPAISDAVQQALEEETMGLSEVLEQEPRLSRKEAKRAAKEARKAERLQRKKDKESRKAEKAARKQKMLEMQQMPAEYDVDEAAMPAEYAVDESAMPAEYAVDGSSMPAEYAVDVQGMPAEYDSKPRKEGRRRRGARRKPKHSKADSLDQLNGDTQDFIPQLEEGPAATDSVETKLDAAEEAVEQAVSYEDANKGNDEEAQASSTADVEDVAREDHSIPSSDASQAYPHERDSQDAQVPDSAESKESDSSLDFLDKALQPSDYIDQILTPSDYLEEPLSLRDPSPAPYEGVDFDPEIEHEGYLDQEAIVDDFELEDEQDSFAYDPRPAIASGYDKSRMYGDSTSKIGQAGYPAVDQDAYSADRQTDGHAPKSRSNPRSSSNPRTRSESKSTSNPRKRSGSKPRPSSKSQSNPRSRTSGQAPKKKEKPAVKPAKRPSIKAKEAKKKR